MAFDPVARFINLHLKSPSLDDNRSHERRLRTSIKEVLNSSPNISLETLRKLNLLPSFDYLVSALVVEGRCGWELTDIKKFDEGSRCYGLAIDLGSTSVVFYLVDISSGETLSTISRDNPQRSHGEDILDRIIFAGKEGGLKILQDKTISLINESIQDITASLNLNPKDIVFISIAGNTTMCHFLLGLDPSHICREPYLPVANTIDPLRTEELGIKCHPGAYLYCFPNSGSYFGGDLIAGIIASGMHRKEELSMLVDVGTNAEVVLGNKDWLVACAGAAGPALEGGIISCGMMAQAGAIERIEINPVTLSLTWQTIANTAPAGICGSGIIDLLSEMFSAGLVEQTGKLVKTKDPSRMTEIRGEPAFIVAFKNETKHGRPIYFTQSDIKNLIRSKGAMYTILNVVVQSVGIDFEDIEHFFVTGAFGIYIDPRKAITIGMLPEIPIERFVPLGNAAGKGAVESLRNRMVKKEVEEILEKITYLEMNVRGDFMNQLTASLFLPHTDLTRFPEVARALNLDKNHMNSL